MSNQHIFLSKKGLRELKKNIHRLEVEKKNVQARLRLIEKGDSHEQRFDRSEIMTRIDTIDAELIEKRQQLTHVKLLPGKRDRLKVTLGSVVELLDAKGRLVRYMIVDSLEANPSDGRISNKSPLGSQLLGRSLQETVKFYTPRAEQQLKLITIS